MLLKENYQNDEFEGNRRYQRVDNSDGTISLIDVTNYSQKGSTFSSEDVNAITGEINRIQSTRVVEVPVNGWSSTYPYKKEISVSGVNASEALEIFPYIKDGTMQNEAKDQGKAYSYIQRVISLKDKIRIECIKKPEFTFYIMVKGVR